MVTSPDKEIASVPFLDNEVSNPEDKQLVAAAVAPLAMGRPFLSPPGIPAERVAALRKALAETFTDPEFIAEADRLQLGITGPRRGEQLQEQLEAAYNQSTKDHEVCKTSHAPGAGRALLPENGSWRQRLMCVPP